MNLPQLPIGIMWRAQGHEGNSNLDCGRFLGDAKDCGASTATGGSRTDGGARSMQRHGRARGFEVEEGRPDTFRHQHAIDGWTGVSAPDPRTAIGSGCSGHDDYNGVE